MNHTDQWKALSSRIQGLVQSGLLHAQYLRVRSSDSYGTGKRLREQSESVLNEILSFREGFQVSLPLTALSAIDKFATTTGKLITDTSGPPDAEQERVWAGLVALAAFEAELSFLLSDTQESIRSRSERAFHHLQRSIVVDVGFREKWQDAFRSGEVACEKLGAVHLLLHGIWAFKVDAAGARTDLVFQEPASLEGVQRYAAGLVLTEWKKAVGTAEVNQRFQEARSQAKRYSQGPLLGSELTNYRYAVVVSERQVEVPNDLKEGNVIYRHINIAVDPQVPSRGKVARHR
jgi:hypothetical protein